MVLTMGVQANRQTTVAEENKATLRAGIETLFNRRNLAAAKDFWADDLVVHMPGEPQPIRGREAVIAQLFAKLQAAFPDMRIAAEDMIAEGDKVTVRWMAYGTHRGDYFGLPATGRAVAVRELAIFRFEDGITREIWLMPDALGTMKQLGMIGDGPPPLLLVKAMGGLARLKTFRERVAALRPSLRWLVSR